MGRAKAAPVSYDSNVSLAFWPASIAPAVSFVNPTENDDSRSQSFSNVNIKDFMTAASAYGISSSMYLTDVFGGFEIWSGGSGNNLGVDEFTCVVNK